MSRSEKYSFAVLSAIVAFSGTAYFWMKYMVQSDDPFAVVNHPLQPSMLHVHVLAAPAFLVAFGVLLNGHVARRIRKPLPNRRSGIVSLATIATMTSSGYMLEVVTTAGWQRACLIVHLASGVVFSLSYVVHLLIGARVLAARRSADRVAA